MHILGAIFDFDGTLANTVYASLEGIRRAVAQTTAQEISAPEIIARFGPSEEGIIQQLVPEAVREEAWQVFAREYDRIHLEEDIHIFPGILPALELLQQAGVRLAIVTGKGHTSAQISLSHFSIASYFEDIISGSLEGSVKEICIKQVVAAWAVPPEQVLYIGDAPTDVGIARAAGVVPIAVAWDPTADPEKLVAQRPHQTFLTPADLTGWLEAQELS